MSLRKKRPFVIKNKNSFIVFFNKLLYSESKFRDWLRQTKGIRIAASCSAQERNYFKVEVMTRSLEQCLELLNCAFSLNR